VKAINKGPKATGKRIGRRIYGKATGMLARKKYRPLFPPDNGGIFFIFYHTFSLFASIIEIKGGDIVSGIIRIELYGEYVKARNEIVKDRLVDWVISKEEDLPFPELTPKHPLLRKFTPYEIFNFEDLFRKDMTAMHCDK
jgi:hypothetical protein